ncbi:MAG: phosphotransferase [Gammaproteobacteria bacterium]|nr:phosphotransferase [Gammaproteobacteria bacterium]
MLIPKDIRENLRFLTIEVGAQVSHLQTFFETASVTVAKRILDRSGYAYNLKIRVHNSCLGYGARRKEGDVEPLALRALEYIATDLERIAELCRDCVHEMGYMDDKRCLRSADYCPMFKRLQKGIALVDRLVEDNDTGLALKLGRIEAQLDRGYRKLKRRYTDDLKQKHHTEDLISALFIAHLIEQMGDALLNISEAIISANLGQPVSTDRYHSIRASVERLANESPVGNFVVESIAETRSGSGISGIGRPAGAQDEGFVAIYKDGGKQKLKEEREGVMSWHEIYPGLAPRILAYKKRGESASLLIEHLAGLTFEQILLHEPGPLLASAMGQLESTLKSVWNETLTRKPVRANYLGQLRQRLDGVYRLHPEFKQGKSRINGYRIPAFEALLEKAEKYEAEILAPFSVYIHGDFNVDNIIYDPMENKISFIDLHRSCYMDYVQDISVFMVSNYRLQVLDPPSRRRIMEVAGQCYRFAGDFAASNGDSSFEIRLALGLARSFVTSTRFILDKALARAMYLRARFLLDKSIEALTRHDVDFRVPVKEIFID